MQSNSKSKLKSVTDQPGWFLTFTCLVLALLLGGSLRVFFSPVRLRHLLESRLVEQKWAQNFTFAEIKLSLADGWWPELGIQMRELHYKFPVKRGECVLEGIAHADEIFVPIEINWLWSKSISVAIDFEALQLLMPATGACDAGNIETVVRPKIEHSKSSLESWSQRWDHQWRNITPLNQYLHSVRIRSFHIRAENQKDYHFERLSLNFIGNDRLAVRSLVKIPREFSYGDGVADAVMSGELTPERLDLQIKGGYREGSFEVHLLGNRQEPKLGVDFKTQHFPLSFFSHFLNDYVAKVDSTSLKMVWVNCHVRAQVEVLRNGAIDIANQGCHVLGDFGKIQLTTPSFMIKNTGVGAGVDFQIEKLNIKSLFGFLGSKGPHRIFTQFGSMTGQLQMTSLKNFKFAGLLQEQEIYFSRHGQTAKQKVVSIPIEVNLHDNKLDLMVENIQLEQGAMRGKIIGTYEFDEERGNLETRFDQIIFHPNVRMLLGFAATSKVVINGNGNLERGQLLNWRGDMFVDDLDLSPFSLSNVKITGTFEDNLLKGELQVDRVLISDALARPEAIDKELQSLKSKFEIAKDRGSWRIESLRNARGEIFRGQGAWETGLLQGQIKSQRQLWTVEATLARPLRVNLQEKIASGQ